MECVKDVIISISSILSTWGPIFQHIDYLTDLEENVASLEQAMNKLDSIKFDYEAIIPNYIRTEQMNFWIDNAKSIITEGRKLTEESRNIRHNFWKSYQLSRRLVKQKEVVDTVENPRKEIPNTTIIPNCMNVYPCSQTMGMDSTYEKILSFLSKDNVGVIGIWGTRRVEKSSLLKTINNLFYKFRKSFYETCYFDVVIFIEASKTLSDRSIQRKIGKTLNLSLPEGEEDKDDRAAMIYSFLTRLKFLLLLDNIREILNIVEVGIPYPNNKNKCKVIFTTRFKEVCIGMNVDMIIELPYANTFSSNSASGFPDQISAEINSSEEFEIEPFVPPIEFDVFDNFITNEGFEQLDDLIEWGREVARDLGFVLTIQKSDMLKSRPYPQVFLGCDRSGYYMERQVPTTQIKREILHTSINHWGCPFYLRAQKLPWVDKWKVKVICGIHNHTGSAYLEWCSFVTKLYNEEDNILKETMEKRDPSNATTIKTIYNDQAATSLDQLGERSSIQHLSKCVDGVLKELCEGIAPEIKMIIARYGMENQYQKTEMKRKLNEIVDLTSIKMQEHVMPIKHQSRAKTSFRELSFDEIIHRLPKFMSKFIQDAKDTTPDGHCGFLAVAGLMGMGEERWRAVRKNLSHELQSHIKPYIDLFGEKEVGEMATSLECEDFHAMRQFWMAMPDMGLLISSYYNVVVLFISNELCLTFLPMRSPAPATHKVIAIGYIDKNHFVQLYMTDDSPIPNIACNWTKYHDPVADGWATPYTSRIEFMAQVIEPGVATREIPED